MNTSETEISLQVHPAPDEGQKFDPAIQVQFRELKAKAGDARARSFVMDSVGGGGGLTGEFIFQTANLALNFLQAVIIAWMKTHQGRKATVKYSAKGKLEKIEASSAEDVIAIIRELEKG